MAHFLFFLFLIIIGFMSAIFGLSYLTDEKAQTWKWVLCLAVSLFCWWQLFVMVAPVLAALKGM